MPEMPDVVAGNTITVAWGNQIRSRTVQRYATAAARTASIPSPTEGDLSYLQDTNTVYVWDGSAWTSMGDLLAGPLRFGTAQHETSAALTTTLTDKASIVFTKPTAWTTYEIIAWGHAKGASGSGFMISRVEIGASNGTTLEGDATPCVHTVASSSTSPVTVALAVGELGGEAVYESSSVTYIARRLT